MKLTTDQIRVLQILSQSEQTLGTGLMPNRTDATWAILEELETLQLVQRRGKLWFLTVHGEQEVARLERT